MGDLEVYPKENYDQQIGKISVEKFNTPSERQYLPCPKYVTKKFIETYNNETIFYDDSNKDLLNNLANNNQIKLYGWEYTDKINSSCIENYPFIYLILKNFKFVEKILLKTKEENKSGFAKIKNPYLHGEVSISRTARYFPANFIFKPFVILSAIFLFFYWLNNLNLFKAFTNQNVISNFDKKFFYFGVLSCLFLILHASFLGLDIDSKLFQKMRKLIIILFILFEILAQFFLVKNLLKFKQNIKNYIRSLIVTLKLFFILIVFITTIIIFSFLAFTDMSTSFKNIAEWNYFSILLIYYLLSSILWKKIN